MKNFKNWLNKYKYIFKFLAIIFLLAILISIFLYKYKKKKEPIIKKEPEIIIEKENFQAGDSLYTVLNKTGVEIKDLYQIINLLSTKINTKYVNISQSYEIERSTDGKFKAFSYCPTQIQKYRVYISTINSNEFLLDEIKEEIKTKIGILEGKIETSLYDAVVNKEKGNPAIAVDLTEIFAWQIDFFTDTRKDDKFFILYKYFYTDSGYYKFDKILLSKYISKSYEYSAFFFNDAYYDENGRALKRAFLKSPLNYKRISSYFTKSRMHPILKYRRPHLGIDYAAASGTPIVSIGDGTVIFLGKSGGFGNLLKIKHPNNYESWYGHLKGFANGITLGKKVKQGQLICFVGATGMATGPHLDFRFKHNNQFINYLTLKIPSSFSLEKKHMKNFKNKINEYYKIIASIKNK